MAMNEKKVVIFDFDGTLADVVPLMREIYDEFAAEHGYPELTEDIYQNLRKSTLKEVLKWVGVKPWQLPGFLRQGRILFAEKRDEVELFNGIAELVTTLHQAGCQIYILSSNSAETIHVILKRNKIDQYITILKRPSLFGKASSIKRLVRKKHYHKSDVWMIGDEVRDIEAANKAGVNCIGVAWGLQHEIALQKANPTHIAMKVGELKNLLIKGEK